MEEERVMLYDPANGELLYPNIRETFYEGFKSHTGKGIIKWIQRIL